VLTVSGFVMTTVVPPPWLPVLVTVSTAPLLVAEPAELVATIVYVPASAVATLAIV